MDTTQRQKLVTRLAVALGNVASSETGCAYLDSERQKAKDWRKDPEWLWWALVRSASTMGNSRPYEKVRLLRHELSFQRLADITPGPERLNEIQVVLKGTGVRRYKWLDQAVEKIKREGGALHAGKRAMNLRNAQEKIDYLLEFHGIGPKYARNIWMDLHDEHFFEEVAVDTRIKSILSRLLQVGQSWNIAETHFVLEAAHAAKLSGWEADRLMYGCQDAFLAQLDAANFPPGRVVGRSTCR